MAPPETPKPPVAPKADPFEQLIAQKSAEAKEAQKASLQAELALLKNDVDLAQTVPMLKDFAPPPFLFGAQGIRQFNDALKQKVLQGLLDKNTSERLADLRVKYVEKAILIKLCDPALILHPYTITVTFDAAGEPVLDLKGDSVAEGAAKAAAAAPAAAPDEAKFEEFAKGSYGEMAKFALGMFDPRGESESEEAYKTRMDAKLRATFRGEGMLGMLFCFAGIIPRDGVFYKGMLDKPWAKELEKTIREAFKTLGISLAKDVADNDAFQALMKVEKTHEDDFCLKTEAVVPPGMVLTVKKFTAGVFPDKSQMEKPGDAGVTYEPGKVQENQTFPAGVKFPPGTVLVGVTVKKQEVPGAAPAVAAGTEPAPAAPAATPSG